MHLPPFSPKPLKRLSAPSVAASRTLPTRCPHPGPTPGMQGASPLSGAAAQQVWTTRGQLPASGRPRQATGCRGAAPTVTLFFALSPKLAFVTGRSADRRRTLPPADQRVATHRPKPREPAHAQPRGPGRSGRDAQRRAQHAVGVCAQHTRPREPLLDLALPGAQDMNACYAKRRAGAALACEHVMAHGSIASAVTARRFA